MVHRSRTVLTIVGVVIGIGAILTLVSVGYGLQRMVTEEVTKFDAFSIIDVSTGESSVVKLNSESLQKFSDISSVESVGAESDLAGKIKYGSSVTDVVFYAVDKNYQEYEHVSADKGNFVDYDENKQQIVLSSAIVKLLGITDEKSIIGKEISADVIIIKSLSTDEGARTIPEQQFTISGIVEDNSTSFAYISQNVAKKIGVANYSTVKVKLKDQNQVDTVRNSIENMGFGTEHVEDTLNQINQVFSIVKILLGILGFVAMVVALLGMFNTLTISLLERMREVGYLKVLGARSRDIFMLFITESVLIGVFGGVIGVTTGLMLEIFVNSIVSYFARSAGAFPITILYTPYYFAVLMALFSFIVGLLTGVYPARRAVKVKPLDVLRYE
jgi:putative ABC transport system permease protein